jgi:enoyl-CoA hydratase
MRKQLAASFEEAENNPQIRAIVIAGAGKAFAAGSDVSELRNLTASDSLQLSREIARFHSRISASRKPVIAAVNGWCLGGGFELALACDIRIASDKARFGLPEPTLGLVSGGGGMPRLARITGTGVARHMCLTAEIIDASTALDRGIVTVVVSADDLESEANRLAERLASLAPIALEQVKRVLAASNDSSLDGAIAVEADACSICVETEDYKEGTQAFLEKRPAKFAGR